MRWSAAMIAVLASCASERELPDAQPVVGVHPPGMLDETSPNFHGAEVERRGYDLALCASCHGDDFAGGAADVTCRNCHPEGPDACSTCHPDRKLTGAHTRHLGSGQACSECHVVPQRWDDEGHVRRDGKPDLPPAEVAFGALANATLAAADRKGPPTYEDGTCSNVYCHGAALHAGGGSTTAPRWDATPVGGCTSCHGAPPPSHAQDQCASCHRDAPHLDGALQVGATCTSCHATTPVFANLAGDTLTGTLTVGAHQAHLTGASRLRGPLACSDCHQTPTTVGQAGHLDSALPAEVLPALGWNRTTATCTTACHGTSAPVWTGNGQVFCGSCHGIPPAGHDPALTLFQCATCHPSVDGFGNPVFDVAGASRHLDGVIDVF